MCENKQYGWRHDMPDDQDGQVSRAIVGAVMVQIFAANRAFIANFQITVQQRSGTAIGATPPPPAHHRRFYRAFSDIGLFSHVGRSRVQLRPINLGH